MKLTKNQTSTKTLADLYRAIDRQHAVTITYLKPGETEPTIRTVEAYDIRTTASGRIRVHAMCRLRREARAFYVDRIISYTVHRIGYVLERTEGTTPAKSGIVVRSISAFVAYELERDAITAAYKSRVGLAA